MPGSSKSSRIDLRLILLDRLESLLCGFSAGDVVAGAVLRAIWAR